MEIFLAKKILELNERELEDVLMKLKMENREAYDALVELVDDIL